MRRIISETITREIVETFEPWEIGGLPRTEANQGGQMGTIFALLRWISPRFENIVLGAIGSIVGTVVTACYFAWVRDQQSSGHAVGRIWAQMASLPRWLPPTAAFLTIASLCIAIPSFIIARRHKRDQAEEPQASGAAQKTSKTTAGFRSIGGSGGTYLGNVSIGHDEGFVSEDSKDSIYAVNLAAETWPIRPAAAEPKLLDLLAAVQDFAKQREIGRPNPKKDNPDNTRFPYPFEGLNAGKARAYDDETLARYIHAFLLPIQAAYKRERSIHPSRSLNYEGNALVTSGPRQVSDIERICGYLYYLHTGSKMPPW